MPRVIEPGAEHRKVDLTEPCAEDAHPDHHRRGHLEEVPSEIAIAHGVPCIEADMDLHRASLPTRG
jgi:hypothetical protein